MIHRILELLSLVGCFLNVIYVIYLLDSFSSTESSLSTAMGTGVGMKFWRYRAPAVNKRRSSPPLDSDEKNPQMALRTKDMDDYTARKRDRCLKDAMCPWPQRRNCARRFRILITSQ